MPSQKRGSYRSSNWMRDSAGAAAVSRLAGHFYIDTLVSRISVSYLLFIEIPSLHSQTRSPPLASLVCRPHGRRRGAKRIISGHMYVYVYEYVYMRVSKICIRTRKCTVGHATLCQTRNPAIFEKLSHTPKVLDSARNQSRLIAYLANAHSLDYSRNRISFTFVSSLRIFHHFLAIRYSVCSNSALRQMSSCNDRK